MYGQQDVTVHNNQLPDQERLVHSPPSPGSFPSSVPPTCVGVVTCLGMTLYNLKNLHIAVRKVMTAQSHAKLSMTCLIDTHRDTHTQQASCDCDCPQDTML